MEIIDKELKEFNQSDNRFGNIKFKCCQILAEEKIIHVVTVSSKMLSDELLEIVRRKVKSILPVFDYKVEIENHISYADIDMARRELYRFLTDKYPVFLAYLKEEDILITVDGYNVNYEILFPINFVGNVDEDDVLFKTDSYFNRNFSNDFTGSFKVLEEEYEIKAPVDEPVYQSRYECKRYFTFTDVTKFCDSEEYNKAIYIEDGKDISGIVFFAGYITDIQKRTAKSGNTYYVIRINDRTGEIEGKFFTRDKSKHKKMEKLTVGASIIVRGENKEFNNELSLTIKGINLCLFPENYVIEDKPMKEVPLVYTLIKPQPAEVYKQGGLLDNYDGPPKMIQEKDYVVLDLETTGLNLTEDNVTEIGAIKIHEGKIIEEFHSLINPGKHIDDKIVEKTGITDDMVKDSPYIYEVFPDLMKYLEGTTIVCHNVEFDGAFLKRIAKEENFAFKHQFLDTIEISKKTLKGLKNYKLNTVCDYYGIQFHHHRALSDAYATAELFIELSRTIENRNNS